MAVSKRIVTSTIKGLTGIVCRVDDAALARVPKKGPLIVVANHVNFLDVPVVYSRLQPRELAGFAKEETWDNPLLGALFDLWEAIPLRRGEVDRTALRRALQALEDGKILGMAPEGTRSGDGRLQRGLPGVVILALHSGAPLLPVVYFGAEGYRTNLKRLRRTDFHIEVGDTFFLNPQGAKVTREVRQEMTDEIMYQLAALLPPHYRGVYADLQAATERYLQFPAGSRSNLLRASTLG